MTAYLVDCALFFLLGYGLRRLFRIPPLRPIIAFLILTAIIVLGCTIVEPLLNASPFGFRLPAAGAHWFPFGMGLLPAPIGKGRKDPADAHS